MDVGEEFSTVERTSKRSHVRVRVRRRLQARGGVHDGRGCVLDVVVDVPSEGIQDRGGGVGQRREDHDAVQVVPRRSGDHETDSGKQRGRNQIQEPHFRSAYLATKDGAKAVDATVGTRADRRLQMWDLGGQQALRPSWETYYQDTDAVVLVVDSTDRGRLGTVREELFRLLAHENLRRASVLVLANKQDLADAMTAAELSTSLCLTEIKKHSWHIQASCALTGEGLWEGMEWVSEEVKQKHKAKEGGES